MWGDGLAVVGGIEGGLGGLLATGLGRRGWVGADDPDGGRDEVVGEVALQVAEAHRGGDGCLMVGRPEYSVRNG